MMITIAHLKHPLENNETFNSMLQQVCHFIRYRSQHEKSPDEIDLVALLKACAEQKDLEKGSRVHADILKSGLLGKNVHVGSTLVSMYAKCGKLTKAHEVFCELHIRNAVSWNALISGYVQNGYCIEALECFKRMQQECASPDSVTFLCILKACGNARATCKGENVHANIAKEGILEENINVCNALLDMYGKCGELGKAQVLFDQLLVRDVVSWNVLIAGFVQDGRYIKALNCYEQMLCEGLSADAATLVSVLKSCGSLGAAERGEDIHAKILQDGFMMSENILLGNALLDMYAKCGSLRKATEVFAQFRTKSVVSWNSMIMGYTKHGCEEGALQQFQQMHHENFIPDSITFICILKSCGSLRMANKGKEVHVKIIQQALLNEDSFVGNALVDMYIKCGMLSKAQGVFDDLLIRDESSWNVIIAGYSEHSQNAEALNCFERMQHDGFSPNAITFLSILKVCANVKSADLAEEMHMQLIRWGLVHCDNSIGTALVDMYAKCGLLVKAQEIFSQLPVQNIISWNALISGYVQHGQTEEALNCFERMKCRGLSPNDVTYLYMLKACSRIDAAEKGNEIHDEIIKYNLLEGNIVLGNASVDMYAKSGELIKARDVFDNLLLRDVVSWDVLISGLIQHGDCEQALKYFKDMQCQGICPDAVSFSHILKTYGCMGIIVKGKEIHAMVAEDPLTEHEELIGTALLDMYVSFGTVAKAQEIFDQLQLQNIISWTTLMVGYAQIGQDEVVVDMVNEMIRKGIDPDAVTFTILFNAYSQSGVLEDAVLHFKLMTIDYNIIPIVEHYTCMTDLYSRAGHFSQAVVIIENMPICNCLIAWTTLLGACKTWGDIKLGMVAFEHATELDRNNATAYICMNNIYMAVTARQDDANDCKV